MTSHSRLTSSDGFRRVLREGTRIPTPSASVFVLRAHAGESKVGVAASRKVGNAVARNRAKRLLREAVRLCRIEGSEVVLVARPGCNGRTFQLVASDVARALAKAEA